MSEPNRDSEEMIENRERVTKYFDPDTLDDRPALLGSECNACGCVHFPKRGRCPNCLGETSDHRLSRTGELYTYTRVRSGIPKFDPPYTLGYVDLPEDVRIFTLIEGEDLSLGREMEVFVGEMYREEGEVVESYKFRPTGGST